MPVCNLAFGWADSGISDLYADHPYLGHSIPNTAWPFRCLSSTCCLHGLDLLYPPKEEERKLLFPTYY